MAEWRQIPGFESYEASDQGQVRSIDRCLMQNGFGMRLHKGRLLKPYANHGGYLCFRAAGGKRMLVNRAVAAAFHGVPPTPLHQAAHLDGDKTNNKPRNLKWATPKENKSHQILHGTIPVGARHGRTVLCKKDIEDIFLAAAMGKTLRPIAARYGVSKVGIANILHRKVWASAPVQDFVVIAAQGGLKANMIAWNEDRALAHEMQGM